jgi:hypothetical protein
MTATPYFTIQELKDLAGFSAKDMKTNGVQMSDTEFSNLVDLFEPSIAQMVHRFCNVVDFRPTVVVEYKDGRGASDDDTATSDYLDSDVEFYLRNLYLYDPSLSYTPIVVEEDTSPPTATPSWVTRVERSGATPGDFRVFTDSEVSLVRFHNNIPVQGKRNVRFTYYTGYDPASVQFGDIKMQVMRAFKNLLMLKKKIQESTTVRNYAVRDYSQMFEPFDESSILSESEKAALERYKRLPLDGPMFW